MPDSSARHREALVERMRRGRRPRTLPTPKSRVDGANVDASEIDVHMDAGVVEARDPQETPVAVARADGPARGRQHDGRLRTERQVLVHGQLVFQAQRRVSAAVRRHALLRALPVVCVGSDEHRPGFAPRELEEERRRLGSRPVGALCPRDPGLELGPARRGQLGGGPDGGAIGHYRRGFVLGERARDGEEEGCNCDQGRGDAWISDARSVSVE
jgi:hypothetical protein